jgi:periplasmic divalent cation tolerance protein
MVFLYITCKDAAEASKIGNALVERRAAACVNMWPIHSIYRGEGEKVERASEEVLIVKTIDAKVQAAEDIVRELHSYTTPCIASFSLHRLNREYKEWMAGCLN